MLACTNRRVDACLCALLNTYSETSQVLYHSAFIFSLYQHSTLSLFHLSLHYIYFLTVRHSIQTSPIFL